MNIDIKNIGLDLAVMGSCISIIGVLILNLSHDYRTAMLVWAFSNAIFVIYFQGREKGWWIDALADRVMKWMYVVMLVSGVWGLVI